MQEWQYWNGNNDIEEDVLYLGIFKDLSRSFGLKLEEGYFYTYDDEDKTWNQAPLALLDQELGYFIKQGIQP